MIVYQKTKSEFYRDVLGGEIENVITILFEDKLFRKVTSKEKDSWRNSLHYMNTVLSDPEIPSNAGITIECQIPQSGRRIDFIISGQNEENRDHAVIIELKQWRSAELTEMDGIVRTALGRGLHETYHPSYQAWTYAELLKDYNKTVQEEKITLKPCAYLHDYAADEVITHPFYQPHLDKAPAFLKKDIAKLQTFIKKFVKTGDDGKIMYRIDKGEIRPSKMLADTLVSMLEGNQEFMMIDEQKVVYEKALNLAKKATTRDKHVLIVEGGPGTGKSVVAINLLVNITKHKKVVQYVTKNAAPRTVYASKLTNTLLKTKYSNLFKSSGIYFDTPANTFDALIVDEAHRLNMKSGLFQNLGENQVKEIINAAKFSVFFIDEDQTVTLKDIGTKKEIEKWAGDLRAKVYHLGLESQFRCNGSDGYLAWLDEVLDIRRTANISLKDIGYDFRVVPSPVELEELIREKNKINNKSRMVAGYCWDWVSKTNKKAKDIEIPEFGFAKQWNLSVDGGLWIQMPNSIEQIGCIHTCQGLELDYVGVIVGPDLIVRDQQVITDPFKRSKMDASIKGFKTLLKNKPEEGKALLERIIKNTYRTLMTRGMKGCYVYFTDKETQEYFTNRLTK